jgi:hypothetical protein
MICNLMLKIYQQKYKPLQLCVNVDSAHQFC